MSEHVKCISCRSKYNLPVGASVDHTPLLLACGHTFCRHCVTKWAIGRSQIECPRCHYPTGCNGKSCVKNLWPNLYIVGLLSSMQTLSSVSGHFLNFNPPEGKPQPDKNKKINQKCSECVSATATCRCAQCQVNMCKKCFKIVHNNSRFLRQHQSVSLRQSLVSTECKQHHRLLEFYCEDEACHVCPECLILPGHQDHKVVRMTDKYSSIEGDLKDALSLTCTALSHSDKVKSSLSLEIENIKFDAYRMADYVHQCYQDCVGSLQARFLGLLRRLEAAAQKSCDDVNELLHDIEMKEKPIRDACEDAELILSEEMRRQVVVEPEKLLNVLKSSENLPFQLDINEIDEYMDEANSDFEELDGNNSQCFSNGENKIQRFQFSLDPDVPLRIYNLGEISVNTKVKYVLNQLKDCPGLLDIPVQDIFIEPEIDTEIKTDDRLFRHLQEPHGKHQELVYVTSVENPCKFQVQRCVDKPHIDAIERSLKIYSKRKPLVDEIFARVSIGDCCAAFYQPNRTWYRARVVKVLKAKEETGEAEDNIDGDTEEDPKPTLSGQVAGPKDMVKVLFIDFGNIAKTQASCLRRLPQNLKGIPDLALLCSLNNISPINVEQGWPPDVNLFFTKMIGNRPLLMTTVKRESGCRLVDLHKPAADEIDSDVPVSVRDALLFLGLAKMNFTPILPTPPLQASPRKYLTPSLLPVSTFINVNVCDMVSLNRFSVQLMDSNMSYLLQLMKKLQRWVQKQFNGKLAVQMADGVHPYQVLCPYEGMVCIARYPSDGLWYRAEVLKLLENQMVSVIYVDYGDTAAVHFSYLLKIPEQFTRLPMQALPCQLCDVSPMPGENDFSDMCLKRFHELAAPSQVLMEVRAIKDGIYQVELFDYTDEDPCVLSISDRLYREGFITRMNKSDDDKVLNAATKDSDVSTTEDTISDGVNTPEKGSEAGGSGNISTSSLDGKYKVRVTNVVNPDLFYLQTDAQMENLNKMMLGLQKYFEEDDGASNKGTQIADTWTMGAFCAVHSKTEKRWCRGCVENVEEKENGEVCTVRLIDYGWVEQWPPTSLREMPDDYTDVEEYVSKCCLASVQPAGGSASWTSTATTLFQELVRGEDCMMELRDQNPTGSSNVLPVELFIARSSLGASGGRHPSSKEEYYIAASRLLELEGLALPVRMSSSKRSKGYSEMLDSCSNSHHQGLKPSKLQTKEKIVNPSCWSDQEEEGSGDAKVINPINSLSEKLECSLSTEPVTTEKSVSECENLFSKFNDTSSAESKNLAEDDSSVKERNCVEEFPTEEADEEYYRKYKAASTLPVGEYVPCRVTHIESSRMFYMQRQPSICETSDTVFREEEEWKMVMEQIQEPAQSHLATLTKSDLVSEEPCLCRYLDDNKWHRAVIMSYNEVPQTAIVQYVDFGTQEKVPVSRLRRIPDSMFDFPLRAYPCILANIQCIRASALSIIETFTKEVMGKELFAIVHEDTEAKVGEELSGCFGDVTSVSLYYMEEDGVFFSIAEAIRAHL